MDSTLDTSKALLRLYTVAAKLQRAEINVANGGRRPAGFDRMVFDARAATQALGLALTVERARRAHFGR